jgi:tetratricopeptide (TPR) repeat protein
MPISVRRATIARDEALVTSRVAPGIRAHLTAGGIAACAFLASACSSTGAVDRIYDGRLVRGPKVSAEAYGYALQGGIAEGAGDLRRARAAYEAAVHEAPNDPGILTRLGELRCKLDPLDPAADSAFGRALKLDAAFAEARLGRARCLAMASAHSRARAELDAVTPSERTSVDGEILRLKVLGAMDRNEDSELFERRALTLTQMTSDSSEAWRELLAFGQRRHDPALVARGLLGLLRSTPESTREVEAGVRELVAQGRIDLGRTVAASLVEWCGARGLQGARDPVVARLAVDDAILFGAREQVERRAIQGRVRLDEASARAWLLGRRELALSLATTMLEANPASRSAYAILTLAETYPEYAKKVRIPVALVQSTEALDAVSAFAVAVRLEQIESREVARSWLERVIPASPLLEGDPLMSGVAVDLASKHVLAESMLPLVLRRELVERRAAIAASGAGLR